MARLTTEIYTDALTRYTLALRVKACGVETIGLYNGKAGVAIALLEAAALHHDSIAEKEGIRLVQECLITKSDKWSFETGWGGVLYAVRHLKTVGLLDIDYHQVLGEQEQQLKEHIQTLSSDEEHSIEAAKKIISYAPLYADKHQPETYKRIQKAFETLFEHYAKQWHAWAEERQTMAVETLLDTWHTLVHQALRMGYTPKSNQWAHYTHSVKTHRLKESTLQHLRMARLQGKRTPTHHSIPMTEKHALLARLEDLIALHLATSWAEDELCDVWHHLIVAEPSLCERTFAHYTAGSVVYGYECGIARFVLFLCWLLHPEGNHKEHLKGLLA